MRIKRDKLARLLQQSAKVVNARNTIPILDTVRLIAGDGKLTATATNLDIELSAAAECEGELSACLNAKMLTGIVGKLSGEDVTIEATDADVTIKSGRSRFKLMALPVDDFPTINVGDLPVEFRFNLADLVAPAKFAMSNEATRYYLNGVYLQGQKDALVATATDGHRLASVRGEPVGEFEGIILPRDLVAILPKGDVDIALSSSKVRITTEDATITSKLIEGTYPDYERVIPANNDKIVTVDNEALRQAADRVATISSERERGVRLSIADGEIALWTRGEGEATDAVEATYDGEAIEIGFNSAYIVELLANMPAGPVEIALADSGSPTLFTSAGLDARFVLMPRRV